MQAAGDGSLEFEFVQAGAVTQGHFRKFATELQYDEDQLAASKLKVTVQIGSLDTQDKDRDQTLASNELFDTDKFPTAQYSATGLEKRGAGLEAVGKLTLHGVTRDVRVPLTIRTTKSGVEISGETTIRRLEFGVGQGDWKSTEWVDDDVKLRYRVPLTRSEVANARFWFHAASLDGSDARRRGAVVLPGAGPVIPAGGRRASPSRFLPCSRWNPGCSPGSCAGAVRNCRSPTKACCGGWRAATPNMCWNELREVSIVITQGVNLTEEYFYVLAGTGTSGVLVGQRLPWHDLVAHLNKLPGFDHRGIANAMTSPVNQRFTLSCGAAGRRGQRDQHRSHRAQRTAANAPALIRPARRPERAAILAVNMTSAFTPWNCRSTSGRTRDRPRRDC